MTHLALYRVWRPQSFEDVVGQEHITTTLKNALKEKRFSHAYLFSGPRGTGKTSTAKIFAKTVNCELGNIEEPCNQCNTCKGITNGSILDVVEIDAASNRGVEEIRDLREKVKFAPTEVRYKVYIIDEVHMLTTEAFNALLKTLEEPPSHVIFVLATTEPHKLPLTIISRCQRFDFRRVASDKMIERLNVIISKEGFNIDKPALSLIAKYSEGGMRDALSLVDQVISFGNNNISVEDVLSITGRASRESFSYIVEGISKKDTNKVLNICDQLINEGKDPERILEDLLYYYRDLLLFKSAPSLDEIKEKAIIDSNLSTIADLYDDGQIYQIIEILNKYLYELKNVNQARLVLELALIKISNISQQEKQMDISNIELTDLKKTVAKLEKKIEQLLQLDQSTDNHKETSALVTKSPNKGHINKSNITSNLKQIAGELSPESLQSLLNMWPQILQGIRDRKVTVHAWLLDGEPVGISNQKIIIAFNNVMHRDTTDKPAHKQLIEEIIYETLQKQYSIICIMQKEWRTFLEADQQDLSNDLANHFSNSNKESDLTSRAIKIFGNELVEIKD